jgi:hypothetical protein
VEQMLDVIPEDKASRNFWIRAAQYFPEKLDTTIGEIRTRRKTGFVPDTTWPQFAVATFKQEVGHERFE